MDSQRANRHGREADRNCAPRSPSLVRHDIAGIWGLRMSAACFRVGSGQPTKSARSAHRMNGASRFSGSHFECLPPALPVDGHRAARGPCSFTLPGPPAVVGQGHYMETKCPWRHQHRRRQQAQMPNAGPTLASAHVIELTSGAPVGSVHWPTRRLGARCRPGSRRPGAIAARRRQPPTSLQAFQRDPP